MNVCVWLVGWMADVCSENCKVMIVLSGIKAPQPARAARPGSAATAAEPCSAEAHQFAYKHINQREVRRPLTQSIYMLNLSQYPISQERIIKMFELLYMFIFRLTHRD